MQMWDCRRQRHGRAACQTTCLYKFWNLSSLDWNCHLYVPSSALLFYMCLEVLMEPASSMRWDRSVDLWPASQTCCRSCVNTLLLHYFWDDFAVNLRTFHTENDLNLRTIRMGLWLCYQAWLPKHHLIPWRLPYGQIKCFGDIWAL